MAIKSDACPRQVLGTWISSTVDGGDGPAVIALKSILRNVEGKDKNGKASAALQVATPNPLHEPDALK